MNKEYTQQDMAVAYNMGFEARGKHLMLLIDALDKLTEKAKGLRKWCADKNACDAFDEALAEIEKPKTD